MDNNFTMRLIHSLTI